MLRVGLLGASGRLGRLIAARVLDDPGMTLSLALGRSDGPDVGSLAGRGPVGTTVRALDGADLSALDVLIDVSQPDALAAALPKLGAVALVSGTTGLDAAQRAALDAQAARAPVLVAANFSTGVTLLADLVARASAALPEHDVEIVELHHRGKVDAPSGTALLLAEAAGRGAQVHGRSGRTGVRPRGEVGIHALRLGDVVGEHTVYLCGDGERVLLGHVAHSRETFAAGAVRAARWVVGRGPGKYGMRDVLGLGA